MSENNQVERVGLYIMVFLIFLCGLCTMGPDHRNILDKLDHIETLLTNQAVQPNKKDHN